MAHYPCIRVRRIPFAVALSTLRSAAQQRDLDAWLIEDIREEVERKGQLTIGDYLLLKTVGHA